MADRDYIGSAHNGSTNGTMDNGGLGDRGGGYSARYNNSNDSHRTGTYNPTYVHEDVNSSEAALRRVRTAGSVTMSPEVIGSSHKKWPYSSPFEIRPPLF